MSTRKVQPKNRKNTASASEGSEWVPEESFISLPAALILP